jgi:hypothetical protein
MLNLFRKYWDKFRLFFFGVSAQEWAKSESEARLKFFLDMRSDDMTDEDYRRIYGDDEEAIREAKASWLRAGEEVIEGMKKDRYW